MTAETGERRREAVRRIVLDLVLMPGHARLFNPYAEYDPAVEEPSAPLMRRRNLERVLLRMLAEPPPPLWIGEAPARRGARRSGVPFAEEARLPELSRRLALDPPLERATRPDVATPLSGTTREIWRAVGEGPLPLFWNAVLLHPHHGAPLMRDRRPARLEIAGHRDILVRLADLFRPPVVLAVGRVAQEAAAQAGLPATYVRHPAQGGARLFREGIARIAAAP